jgi:hypothetical protein
MMSVSSARLWSAFRVASTVSVTVAGALRNSWDVGSGPPAPCFAANPPISFENV